MAKDKKLFEEQTTLSLIKKIIDFKKLNFKKDKAFYQKLAKGQNPHTLFITCCDSRIVPNLITKTKPGELFMVRNIANLIPPYQMTQEYLATTSAIEYALNILQVQNIIICGHSNCGGCNALWHEERLEQIPHVKKWLELGKKAKFRVLAKAKNIDLTENQRACLTEKFNILQQMKHLITYPGLKAKVKAGKLIIWGWYYEIENGEIFIYSKRANDFLPAKDYFSELKI